MKYKFNLKPDLKDQRDFIYKAPFKIFTPQKVDLRQYCSLVENQRELGSCTAQAIAGCMEFLDKKLDNIYLDVSRLFIYYNTRLIEGTVNEDSGATIRNTIKSVVDYGACPENLLPYVTTNFAQKPSEECYTEALKNRVSLYERLLTLNDMLICLSDGFPVICGISIYTSFTNEESKKTGIINMPAQNESLLGGHAIMLVGYDKDTKRFIARNSWGASWGQQGYFTIPFEYIENLGHDYWTIKKTPYYQMNYIPRIGDIFLCDSDRTGAKIVKFFMTAPTVYQHIWRKIRGTQERVRFYHAGLISGENEIIEQQGKVQYGTVEKILSRKIIIYRMKNLTLEQKQQILNRAKADLGKGYDILQILGKTLTWLTGIKFFTVIAGKLTPNQEICVTRVVAWFKDICDFGVSDPSLATTKIVDEYLYKECYEGVNWEVAYENKV